MIVTSQGSEKRTTAPQVESEARTMQRLASSLIDKRLYDVVLIEDSSEFQTNDLPSVSVHMGRHVYKHRSVDGGVITVVEKTVDPKLKPARRNHSVDFSHMLSTATQKKPRVSFQRGNSEGKIHPEGGDTTSGENPKTRSDLVELFTSEDTDLAQ